MTDKVKRTGRGWSEIIEISERPSRPSGVVFLLLSITLVFSTLFFGAVDEGIWVVLTIQMLAIVIAWFLDAWNGRGFLLNRHVLLVPLAGLIAIGVIQVLPLFPSSVPAGVLSESRRSTISLEPYATKLFLVRLVCYLVFLAASLTFINSGPRLRKVVVLTIVFGAALAFFGILQRLAYPDAIYGLRGSSQAIPFGPFVNQHHFAGFMSMTSGVTFGFLFGHSVERDKRMLLAIAAVVMGVATVMTSSRGGMLSLAGTLAFAVAVSLLTRPADGSHRLPSGHRPKIAAVAGAAAMIFVVVGVVLYLGADSALVRAVGLGEAEDITNGRSHFWPIAWRIFIDHPFVGAGLDAFGTAFTRYDSWPGLFRVEQAHNDYLQSLADAGVAGFACVAGYIYLLFKKGLAAITGSGDVFRLNSAIGALAGCFGILIHSFFDFPLRTPSNAFFFLMLSAIAVVRVRSVR